MHYEIHSLFNEFELAVYLRRPALCLFSLWQSLFWPSGRVHFAWMARPKQVRGYFKCPPLKDDFMVDIFIITLQIS